MMTAATEGGKRQLPPASRTPKPRFKRLPRYLRNGNAAAPCFTLEGSGEILR
jgi:hypothetical protein